MCLAQGHNAVTPVRLKPAVMQSRVKHSTTEPPSPCTILGTMPLSDNTFERIRLDELCMHEFEQTFGKFHICLSKLIIIQNVLCDQTTTTLKIICAKSCIEKSKQYFRLKASVQWSNFSYDYISKMATKALNIEARDFRG